MWVVRIAEGMTAIAAAVYLLLALYRVIRRVRGTRLWLPLLVLCGLTSTAQATTYTAAACNGTADHTKVQTEVNSASDGDTVQIQAGTCTFSGPVTWSNKNITVQGAGQASTIINATAAVGQAFAVTATTKAGFRITTMTVNTATGTDDGLFKIAGSGANSEVPGRFRIDHITSTISGNSTSGYAQSPRMFMVTGLVYGVIDHLTGLHTTGITTVPIFVEHQGNTAADGTLTGKVSVQDLPLDLGGDTAVYVEDSTLTTQVYGGINDSSAGGRMVLRYNTYTGPMHLQTHSTRYSDYGGFKSEYYNSIHDAQSDPDYPGTANMLSGTGVMFNTQVKNVNIGDNDYQKGLYLYFQRCPGGGCEESSSPLFLCGPATSYDEAVEGTGWPCLNQPGRGGGAIKSEASVPVYFWNVGSDVGCATGVGCNNDYHIDLNCTIAVQADFIKTTTHSNGDKDYCEGGSSMPSSCGNHTNTYTPYTYPHPSQGVAEGVAAGTSVIMFISKVSGVEWVTLAAAVWHLRYFRNIVASLVMACWTMGLSTTAFAGALTFAAKQTIRAKAETVAMKYLDYEQRQGRR